MDTTPGHSNCLSSTAPYDSSFGHFDIVNQESYDLNGYGESYVNECDRSRRGHSRNMRYKSCRRNQSRITVNCRGGTPNYKQRGNSNRQREKYSELYNDKAHWEHSYDIGMYEENFNNHDSISNLEGSYSTGGSCKNRQGCKRKIGVHQNYGKEGNRSSSKKKKGTVMTGGGKESNRSSSKKKKGTVTTRGGKESNMSSSKKKKGTVMTGKCKNGAKAKNACKGDSSKRKFYQGGSNKTIASRATHVTGGKSVSRKQGTQNCKQIVNNKYSVRYNELQSGKGNSRDKSKGYYENKSDMGSCDDSYDVNDWGNSYGVCRWEDSYYTKGLRDKHKNIVGNTKYTHTVIERKADGGENLIVESDASHKIDVETALIKETNNDEGNVRNVDHCKKWKSWSMEEDTSKIKFNEDRSNKDFPQVKKLGKGHETSVIVSEISSDLEAVSEAKKLVVPQSFKNFGVTKLNELEKNKTFSTVAQSSRNAEATYKVKKFTEKLDTSVNVTQYSSNIESNSQVDEIKEDWETFSGVLQNPGIIDTTSQMTVFTKPEAIHQGNVFSAEPQTDLSQIRMVPAIVHHDLHKIKRTSGSTYQKKSISGKVYNSELHDKDKFQTIVLITDPSYYENLKSLERDGVKVICDDFLSIETVVDVIQKNKEDVGNNGLWLLVAGIFDLVTKELDKRCKHCEVPITHICPLWNLEHDNYDCVIDEILQASDNCVRVCQATLGFSGVVALAMPLPALIVKSGDLSHKQLHWFAAQGSIFVTEQNYHILDNMYNKFCNKWITLACWKLQKFLDASVIETFKMESSSKYVSCSSVSSEWYSVMNNFFTLVLNSYYPKETLHRWLAVRSMFDQVIVVGHTSHTRLLQSLVHEMPVTFYEETMDFDEKGLTQMNHLMEKWPTRTLWCVVIGVTAIACPMKNADSKCSVATPKCRSPLPVFVSKNHALQDVADSQLVKTVVKSAFDFVSRTAKKMGIGSAFFVAPIIPQQVVCADMNSQESHSSLHQIFERDPTIPFLVGSPSCWVYNAFNFAEKWLTLSKETFLDSLSSPSFIEEYALPEDCVLTFINSREDLCATTHQLEWSKLMVKSLEYFLSLRINDPFPFTFGMAEPLDTTYEVCKENYGSFDDFISETAPGHEESFRRDFSVLPSEDGEPSLYAPVKVTTSTACTTLDSPSTASPVHLPSTSVKVFPPSLETVEDASSAKHSPSAQVTFPAPSTSMTGLKILDPITVPPQSSLLMVQSSLPPETDVSSSAQVIFPVPSTSMTGSTVSAPMTVFLNSPSVPAQSSLSSKTTYPSPVQTPLPVLSASLTGSIVPAPVAVLPSSPSMTVQRSLSSGTFHPSPAQEITIPSTSVIGSIVSTSVTDSPISATCSSSPSPSQATRLTSSKKGHIIIRNIETQINQSEALELFTIFGKIEGMEWPSDGSGTLGRYLMVIYGDIYDCKRAARVLNFLKVFGDKSKLKLFGSKRNDEKLTLKKNDMSLVLSVYEVMEKIKENKKILDDSEKNNVCKDKPKAKKKRAGKSIEEKVGTKSKKTDKKKLRITDPVIPTNMPSVDSEHLTRSHPQEVTPSSLNEEQLSGYTQGPEDVTEVIKVLVSYSGDLIPVESIDNLFLEIGALEAGILKEGGLLFFFRKYCIELELLENFRFPDGKMKVNVVSVIKVKVFSEDERKAASLKLKCAVLKLLRPVEEKLKESLKREINVYTFKTRPCQIGLSCPTKEICQGYHGRKDKRRPPLIFDYSLEMCTELSLQGSCSYRDSCSKAHSAVEKMMHISFYRSLLCPFVHRKGYCEEMRSICYHAHKGEPDMFYNDSWENLYVEGLGNTLNFLSGAVTNFYKLPNMKCPQVLLITPSQYMADLYLNCISDLTASCNQKAVKMEYKTSCCSDAAVIITTLETILPLLPLPNDMMLTQDINLRFLKALIIDDGPRIFSSLDKSHADAFHSFGRNITDLNIVITAEELSDFNHKLIKEILNLKNSIVIQGSTKPEGESSLKKASLKRGTSPSPLGKSEEDREIPFSPGKERKTDRVPSTSCLSTKFQPPTRLPLKASGSPKSCRFKSTCSLLETSSDDKECLAQKSASVNKKRLEHKETSDRKRKLSDDAILDKLMMKHTSSGSSDEEDSTPDERRRELLQAIEVLEKKRDKELQLYIDTPMIHPLYDKKYRLFMKKYKKDFPEKINQSHVKKLWKKYWLVNVKEFLSCEYQCRFENLTKKLKSVTQNSSPESGEKVLSEDSSASGEDNNEKIHSFSSDYEFRERKSSGELPLQLQHEVHMGNVGEFLVLFQLKEKANMERGRIRNPELLLKFLHKLFKNQI
ncbi:uncharacterized protein LOC135205593 [Macrobrachium nipponense]|uniref:uncharacterized protein LOC135205593 n=1 Tax=Macrobrachium nipponense TaxID=159736 RepID=UPI0030C7E5D7